MKGQIVRKLNGINKQFYEKVAPYFDASRDYFWPGWEELLGYVENLEEPVEVLDVGCGNGRFGEFLATKGVKAQYIGVDSNAYLLEKAQERVPHADLYEADILDFDYAVLNKKFDLIALFGVLHHIPGYSNRSALLKRLRNLLLAPKNSFIAFNSWDFYESAIFQKRVPWEKVSLLEADLEEGDWLLPWNRGEDAFRYCHYLSDVEVEKLLEEAGLNKVTFFKSGEKGDFDNKYLIASV